MTIKTEYTLADLEKEMAQAPKDTGKGAKVDVPAKDKGTKDNSKFDNSHTVWVNGPAMEKFGVIQLRIPLEEFNELYPDTDNAVIGFKKTERSFQVVMKYGDQTLLIGTYFPPKGWTLADIKATAGKRVFGFKPSIIEIEIDEDDLI